MCVKGRAATGKNSLWSAFLRAERHRAAPVQGHPASADPGTDRSSCRGMGWGDDFAGLDQTRCHRIEFMRPLFAVLRSSSREQLHAVAGSHEVQTPRGNLTRELEKRVREELSCSRGVASSPELHAADNAPKV